MKKYNVAVVGATGAVGGEMLRVLRERRFPVKGLKLLASPRSKGRRIAHNGATYTVDALSGRSFAGIDVALDPPVDLDVAVAGKVAGDLQAFADDRRHGGGLLLGLGPGGRSLGRLGRHACLRLRWFRLHFGLIP